MSSQRGPYPVSFRCAETLVDGQRPAQSIEAGHRIAVVNVACTDSLERACLLQRVAQLDRKYERLLVVPGGRGQLV